MYLKECVHGILVENDEGHIGMVVGITNNCPSATLKIRQEKQRAITLVQWSYQQTPQGVHPANIKPFNG